MNSKLNSFLSREVNVSFNSFLRKPSDFMAAARLFRNKKYLTPANRKLTSAIDPPRLSPTTDPAASVRFASLVNNPFSAPIGEDDEFLDAKDLMIFLEAEQGMAQVSD